MTQGLGCRKKAVLLFLFEITSSAVTHINLKLVDVTSLSSRSVCSPQTVTKFFLCNKNSCGENSFYQPTLKKHPYICHPLKTVYPLCEILVKAKHASVIFLPQNALNMKKSANLAPFCPAPVIWRQSSVIVNIAREAKAY